ncbi:sphingomyelin phosphodiesterase 4-like [Oncorhynchus nerka]|uniref:sphingomyelin phosphodiesterase 4-like n=1 Tax=Oncorhynchus nerka TaxID=8023 RepID=UPI0031B865C2
MSSSDHLKTDWTIKSLPQQCTEMTKDIDDKPVKELCVIFPWMVERVVGSLDGSTVGWSLSSLQAHSSDYSNVLEFLQPSGPMLKLVYKLQAEDYNFEIQVANLPGVISNRRIFLNKLPSQNHQRLSLNAFEYFMFYFATSVITQRDHHSGQQTSISNSVYFALVDAYFKHFLPTEGSPHSDVKGTLTSHIPRSSRYSETSKGLLKCQCPVNAETTNQSIWRSGTMLQIFLEIWLPHFPLETHQKLNEVSVITEEHILVVRQLVKHMHALSGKTKLDQSDILPSAHSETFLSEDFKRVVTSEYVQRLYLLLLHCFKQWPMETSFRAVLETWLSYIQPWRYQKHVYSENKEKWASFIQENILMYTRLFSFFLKRFAHVDLVNVDNATMVFRMTKVFAQTSLPELIENGEKLLLHQGPILPSTLMASQVPPTEIAALLKTHINNKKLQMFGVEMRAEVLKLVQRLMQAQQTAKTTLDPPANVSVGQFLCSWKRLILKTNSESGGGDMIKSDMKTVELLKKTVDHLNQVFNLNTGHLSQMMMNMGSVEESKQLPDCIHSENGLILTDLGRMQIINGLRRFDIEYQGDPQLQPVRSYENAVLVQLMFWIATLINNKLEGHMNDLCSQQNLLGRLGQHYLITSTVKVRFPRSTVTQQSQDDYHLRPRLTLRTFASYRTLLILLLLYSLGSLFSISPLFSTCLILILSFLYGLCMTVYVGK